MALPIKNKLVYCGFNNRPCKDSVNTLICKFLFSGGSVPRPPEGWEPVHEGGLVLEGGRTKPHGHSPHAGLYRQCKTRPDKHDRVFLDPCKK